MLNVISLVAIKKIESEKGIKCFTEKSNKTQNKTVIQEMRRKNYKAYRKQIRN